MSLSGQVALVTGGARGIGKGYSQAMLQRGAKVIIVDTHEINGRTTEAELKTKYGDANVNFHVADVTDMAAMTSIHDAIVEEHGHLDILINNAGIGGMDIPTEPAVRINTLALFEIGEMVSARMRKDQGGRGGVIINIGSIAGLITSSKGGAVYHGTKTAVVSYTAAEGSAFPDEAGVKMVSINPTFVDTEMVTFAKEAYDEGNQFMIDIVDMCGGWVDKSLVVDTVMGVIENPSSVPGGGALYVTQEQTYMVDFHVEKTPIDNALLEPLGGSCLRGKVALVTGGARGLGKRYTEAMLQRGAKVVFLDILTDVAQATEQEFRGKYGQDSVSFQKCDVTDMERVTEVKNWTLEEYGSLDIVINNAGTTNFMNCRIMTELYLMAPMLITQMALEHMQKSTGGNGGTIINIGSCAGLMQLGPGQGLYKGTKHGIVAYSHVEGSSQPADSGVDIFTVCPTFVDTDLVADLKTLYDNGDKDVTELIRMAGGWVDASRVVAVCMMCLERPSDVKRGVPIYITQDELVHAVRTWDKTPFP